MISYTFSKPQPQTNQPLPKFEPIYDSQACFSTQIYTSSILSNLNLPINLNSIPFFSTKIVQPPLREGEVDLGEVGTQSWKSIQIELRGHLHLVHFKPHLNPLHHHRFRFGDGIRFPDFRPYPIGFHWSDLTIKFPLASLMS